MRPQPRITTATRTAEQFAKKSNPYESLLSEMRELKNELHNLSSVVAIVQQEVHDTRKEIRDTREEVRDTRKEIRDTREELRDVRKEFGERMNHLETEMRSATRHSQILTASVVGIAVTAFGIATAVVYSMLR